MTPKPKQYRHRVIPHDYPRPPKTGNRVYCPDCRRPAHGHVHRFHCLGPFLREQLPQPPGGKGRPTFWETWGYPKWDPGHEPSDMIGPCRARSQAWCTVIKRPIRAAEVV